jgi:hypothetical protein
VVRLKRSGVVGTGGRRGRAVVGSMLLLLAACTGSSAASSDPSPTATPAAEPSAQPTKIVLSSKHATHPWEFTDTRKFDVAPEDMPYPYTTPTPPDERTPIDGTYLRILTLDDVDGLLPFRCLRCPPFFPNAGVSTIAMSKGNYWINHQLSDFRSLGMYTIDGDRITFFNDPWCPQDHGTYRWAIHKDELTFEPVSGTCGYEQARTKDLTTGQWIHIKPCVYRIVHLWPGPVAC